MGTITSQITSIAIVYSTVYSGADQRKHQSSVSLVFVRGIHRGPVNFPHKWSVTRKMFPFDDVIMFRVVFIKTMPIFKTDDRGEIGVYSVHSPVYDITLATEIMPTVNAATVRIWNRAKRVVSIIFPSVVWKTPRYTLFGFSGNRSNLQLYVYSLSPDRQRHRRTEYLRQHWRCYGHRWRRIGSWRHHCTWCNLPR